MADLLQICEPGETPEPHANDRTLAIGIDLGTTNSVVAIAEGGVPEVLRDEDGRAPVPSVVAYAPDGSAIVGELAGNILLDRPDAVVSSIKRLMGRGIEDVRGLAGTLPFDVVPPRDGESRMARLRIGGRVLSPVEISADILRALKDRAEEKLDASVGRAVITVPAYFDDAARTATRDAAQLAGLEVLRLVNEPTAAALAHGLDTGSEGLYAVYDLGGGTFDISLLKMRKGVFQVLATGGDSALGGDDFDHAIAEYFLGERAKVPGRTEMTGAEVKMALTTARLAKECLSHQEEGTWALEIDGERSTHKLTREILNGLVAALVDRTIRACDQALEDAGVDPEEVGGVVLVGGSTRVPLVREKVRAFFGKEPLSDINPDEVVALGAALQAEALTGGSETLLLDVVPLSLGIETMGGLVEKVIPRNTPIPVAKAQEFTTHADGQSAMAIHVLQGEREMVDQNRSLAKFDLRGIPPMTAGAARIRVTFEVDADGLLTVSAEEKTTGARQYVAVKPSYGLGRDEMARMLRDSARHAGDDMKERLLAEARVEADRSITAVVAALGKDGGILDARERASIDDALRALEKAVKGTDRHDIASKTEALELVSRPFAGKRMDRGIRAALRGVSVEELERAAEADD